MLIKPHIVVGAGIVLLVIILSASAYSLRPAYESEKPTPPSPAIHQNWPDVAPPQNTNQEREVSYAPSDIENSSCKDPRLPSFGTLPQGKDLLVYTTACQYALYADNAGATAYRFYARDAEGTYNRLLFTADNKPEWGGGTYGTIVGIHNNVLAIDRATGPVGNTVYLDAHGKDMRDTLLPFEVDLSGKELPSPNKRFVALSRYLHSKSNSIEIYDTQTATYTPTDLTEDIYILKGWSPDSTALYVSKGAYEGPVRASLWKISPKDGTAVAVSLASDDALWGPVIIDSQAKYAYVRGGFQRAYGDGDNMASSSSTSIYAFNLTNASQTLLLTGAHERSLQGIVGDFLLTTKYKGGGDSSLELLNVKTHTTSTIDSSWTVAVSNQEGWLVTEKQDNMYYFVYPQDGREISLGKGTDGTMWTKQTLHQEYISDIVGVVPHQTK